IGGLAVYIAHKTFYPNSLFRIATVHQHLSLRFSRKSVHDDSSSLLPTCSTGCSFPWGSAYFGLIELVDMRIPGVPLLQGHFCFLRNRSAWKLPPVIEAG